MRSIDLTAVAEARRLASSGEARRIRLASQLKVTELAAYLNKTPATISRWESNARKPNAEDAVRWVKMLHRLEALEADRPVATPGGDAA